MLFVPRNYAHAYVVCVYILINNLITIMYDLSFNIIIYCDLAKIS